MSSKTKIVVLHMKEIIYTAVFAGLGILLILLLIFMFGPGHKKDASNTKKYMPGIYTSGITMNNMDLEVEVSVDESHINSIRFVNLDETVTTMYPLIQPALEEIADQVCESQTTENIAYSDSTPYTSQVILDAVRTALEKATVS